MLLNVLSKEEKFYFLDLLICVVSVDGPVTDYEKQVLSLYKAEMGDDINKYRKSNLKAEQLMDMFSEKSKVIKNIVYYNISWASLSDEFYSAEEHFILDDIQKKFGITNRKKVELLKAVYAERDLKEKVKRIVFE